MKALLLIFALLAGLLGAPAASPMPFPYHAFCKTLWLFGMPCGQVATKLVHQIQTFSPPKTCEKCYYTLISASNSSILAQHTSPDKLMSERLEINLHTTTLTHSCRVSALSMSLEFTSILDGGLNYCNLNDLLIASGLNAAPGFMEMISEWACLGYGLATCT